MKRERKKESERNGKDGGKRERKKSRERVIAMEEKISSR